MNYMLESLLLMWQNKSFSFLFHEVRTRTCHPCNRTST